MKKLEINFPSIDSELVDKICKLQFFGKLKTFELGPKVENPKIGKFLNAGKMKCRVGRLTAKDIAVVTEAYLAKNLGAYFKIFTDRPIELNEIFRVINFMPWPMPITITNGAEPDVRIQHYTISSDPQNSLELLVKISKFEFKGILCRIDFEEDLNLRTD
ncbi:hypothetical protein B9Z55_021972 [Caenorhabditis nigoni]|nr:hypothetical protein B9Z55_021972 [Caenorhabditis nigoni]